MRDTVTNLLPQLAQAREAALKHRDAIAIHTGCMQAVDEARLNLARAETELQRADAERSRCEQTVIGFLIGRRWDNVSSCFIECEMIDFAELLGVK